MTQSQLSLIKQEREKEKGVGENSVGGVDLSTATVYASTSSALKGGNNNTNGKLKAPNQL